MRTNLDDEVQIAALRQTLAVLPLEILHNKECRFQMYWNMYRRRAEQFDARALELEIIRREAMGKPLPAPVSRSA